TVFINAKDANVQIVAGILKVIRVSTEKSHLLLRRENEPHVIVAFVSIQMISAALVERNDVGAQPGFLFAFLFNRSDDSVARSGSLVARHSRLDRGVYPRSDIVNRH